MSKGNFLENAVINHFLRNSSQTAGVGYIALHTADPTDAGTGAEVANAGAYARQAVTFSAPSDGVTSNSGEVTFPVATAGWGLVTHAALWTSATWGAGNLLYHGALGTSKTINTDDQAKFAVGDIQVTET